MPTRTRSRIATTLAVAALLASSLANTPPVRAQSSQSASARSLEGAWWVTVTLYNCATGAKRPPFSSILLFSRGGTVIETTSNPAFLPGQRSIGVGTWARTTTALTPPAMSPTLSSPAAPSPRARRSSLTPSPSITTPIPSPTKPPSSSSIQRALSLCRLAPRPPPARLQ